MPRLATYTQYWSANSRARYPNADFALALDVLMKDSWASIERRVLATPA